MLILKYGVCVFVCFRHGSLADFTEQRLFEVTHAPCVCVMWIIRNSSYYKSLCDSLQLALSSADH